MLAAYALFAVILFVAFLVASFPYADTISSIAAPMKLKVVYRAQGISLPIGARLESVQIISTAAEPDQVLLQSPDVTVAPTLALLLLGRPGLRISAQIFGGVARATVRERAAITEIEFDLDSLNLAQSDPLQQLGAILKGEVSMKGSAEVKGPDITDNTAHAHLNGTSITFAIVSGFPPIHFGTVSADVALSDATVSFANVKARGLDADIAANGEIQLARDVRDSTIDMTVALKPTSVGRDNFGLFLRMLPHPPAAGPYHIQGRLMSPTIR